MSIPPCLGLSEAEKDSLLFQQQEMIERLVARITELEALVGKPRKTSTNSHYPPSKDGFGGKKRSKAVAGKRPPREGKARPLADTPDKTERVIADACGHCGTDVSAQTQHCRHRYDHIDLPPIAPIVTRIELFGGRCRGCGQRYRAQAPAGMPPGTPICTTAIISEGAIANIFRRMGQDMAAATKAIGDTLLSSRIIASDETTTRTNGITQWQWVFILDKAVLHKIAPRQSRSVAEEVLGDHQPDV